MLKSRDAPQLPTQEGRAHRVQFVRRKLCLALDMAIQVNAETSWCCPEIQQIITERR